MIGTALGMSGKAEQLVADTEQSITDAAAQYPALEGKSFIYGNLAKGASSVYTSLDNRPKFLTELGLVQSPVVDENAPADAFYFLWADEDANQLDSDIFVTWVADDEAAASLVADPLLGQIPALKNGALVADSDAERVFSVSAINVLSVPYALENVVPMIAEAAAAADAAK